MGTFWLKYIPSSLRAKIGRRHNLQTIVSNSGWLFADKILRLTVGLIVGAWIIRFLGPEQYGLWTFAVAFTALFGAASTLGLDGIVVRELVRRPKHQDQILGTAFGLKLIGGIAVLFITSVAISFMRKGDTLTFSLVGISAAGFIFQATNVIDFYFQANVQSRYAVYSANAAFLIMTLVRLGLLLGRAPLMAFATAGLIEIALTSLFLVIAYLSRRQSVRKWRYTGATARELLKACWPLILSGITVLLYMRIDQIMIGDMLGNQAVGIYSAAVRISEVWYFFPMAIVSSVFPTIIRTKSENETLYYQRLQSLFDIIVILGLGVAIAMTFASRPIVHLLFGDPYMASASVLSLHIWTGVFVGLGVASQSWFLAEGLQKYSFYRTLVGLIVNILLNYFLIPRLGVNGAAVATLASQIVAAYAMDVLTRKTRAMFFLKSRSLFLIGIPRRIHDVR
jgi:PST family polysaccharide transporter